MKDVHVFIFVKYTFLYSAAPVTPEGRQNDSYSTIGWHGERETEKTWASGSRRTLKQRSWTPSPPVSSRLSLFTKRATLKCTRPDPTFITARTAQPLRRARRPRLSARHCAIYALLYPRTAIKCQRLQTQKAWCWVGAYGARETG